MKLNSTEDVSIDLLRDLAADLKPDLDLEVDERQLVFRAFDAPSWITFVTHLDWWVQLLAGYGALYIAEIVKEAAKETWKNRATTIEAAGHTAVVVIRRMADAIARLRSELPARTKVALGLPIPSEHIPTQFDLVGSDLDELFLQILVFAIHQDRLSKLIETEILGGDGSLGPLLLKLLDDNSLEVTWIGKESESLHTKLLALPNDEKPTYMTQREQLEGQFVSVHLSGRSAMRWHRR
jgi:hypothetical protein